MKKWSLILVAILLVVILFASISVVLANNALPMECLMDIVFDEYEEGVFYWYGPVYGCDLTGYVRFDGDPDRPGHFEGNTLHYYELFTIYPDSGGEIHGYDAGVSGYFKGFKFRANGWVTDVSPEAAAEWGHLVGAKFFEMGTVDPSAGIPVTAYGSLMRLAPAQRPMP